MPLGEHNYNTYQVSKKIARKKVAVQALEEGMYVVELDRPWLGTPFLFQGFIIREQKELTQLKELCKFVYIDESQSEHLQREKHSGANAQPLVKRPYQSIEKVLPESIGTYDRAKQALDKALYSFRVSEDISMPEVRQAVRSCVSNIIKNPHAMLWLTQIKNKDDYTAEHSVRVSVIAVALGRELGLNNAELEDLGIGAMLHDVGKVKVPDEILNKEGKLDDDEHLIIKKHTEFGHDMLLSKSDVPAAALDVAYNHHEQLDGKGYPRGLKGDEIPYFAKIVSAADAFDAITSDRVYRKGRSSLEALRILYDCRGSQFDEHIINAFIRLIGVYPPGHIVELSNGEAGITLSAPPNNKLKPKLIVVRNKDKKLCQERVVDLSTNQIAEDGSPLRIKEVYTDGTFGIHLQEYKDRGLNFSVFEGMPA